MTSTIGISWSGLLCREVASLSCPALTYSLFPVLLVAETLTDIEPRKRLRLLKGSKSTSIV